MPGADASDAEDYCILNDLLSNVLACVKFLCLVPIPDWTLPY